MSKMIWFDTVGSLVKGVNVKDERYIYYSEMVCHLAEIPRGKFVHPFSDETFALIGKALCQNEWNKIHR